LNQNRNGTKNTAQETRRYWFSSVVIFVSSWFFSSGVQISGGLVGSWS